MSTNARRRITASAVTAHPARPCAGIIAYNPDPELFRALLSSLRGQTTEISVFVNGGLDRATDAAGPLAQQVRWIEAPANLGVGEALNVLCLDAILRGADRLAVFDQDSAPPVDVLARLSAAMDSLESAGERPAAVAPRLVAPPESKHKPPRYLPRASVAAHGAIRPVLYAPTSGTLIRLAGFREVGSFRADYFIDGVDVEWCLRAWSRGWSCWIVDDAAMAHRIGRGVTSLAPGVVTPTQADWRLEAYVRNATATMRLPHASPGWRLRQAAYMAAQIALLAVKRGDLPFLKRMANAVRDGHAGALGPPRDAPDAVRWP